MRLSFDWLRELVPSLPDDPAALAERFTMLAAAVEDVETVGEGLDGIVAARVLRVRPHPNADRLSLCVVDRGDGEPLDVVCGAPVIAEGALYPHIAPGGMLPGDFAIESREIRGEVSHGMLCSEMELGLGSDRGGIMRLPDDLAPGTPILEALGLPDARLTLDLNPNRVDLACHIGAAREVASGPLVARDFGGPGWTPGWREGPASAEAAGVRVTIEDPDRCPCYLAAVIRGVRVGSSPAWLAGRLLAVGWRPINNVVDATNYVLLERNQPLHAFDLGALAGPEIRVRAARPGEPLTTLDGAAHELGRRATVIADRDRAVALAGVMGGLETEVTAETTDLLIECALFDPHGVRDTARSTGLATEASYRFERGIDPLAQEEALVRCAELILAIAGGEAEDDGIRTGRAPAAPPELELRPARVTRVLGIELDREELDGLLAPIGFESLAPAGKGPATASGEGAPRYRVPGWRGDVTREIDLVEEVARRYGYDAFPEEDRRFRPSAVPEDPALRRADLARRTLVAQGFHEARSLTFVPEEQRGSRAVVAVPNPLSAEESFLRAALVPVLLRRVEHNFARGRRDVGLFEIGTAFGHAPEEGDAEGNGGVPARFQEEMRVALVWTGGRAPAHWDGPGADVDLWDLKGRAEEISRLCAGALEPLAEAVEPAAVRFGGGWLDAEAFRLLKDARTVGAAGRVAPAAIDAPPWAGAVFALELELAAIELGRTAIYRELSPFPPVRRDLSVTLPSAVPAGEVERALVETASELLESVRLFDVYAGEGIEEGRRALGWAFRFRAPDRTLTDEDVEPEMTALAAVLEERFDARIRRS